MTLALARVKKLSNLTLKSKHEKARSRSDVE